MNLSIYTFPFHFSDTENADNPKYKAAISQTQAIEVTVKKGCESSTGFDIEWTTFGQAEGKTERRTSFSGKSTLTLFPFELKHQKYTVTVTVTEKRNDQKLGAASAQVY